MTLICIETSTSSCSLTLMVDGEVLVQYSQQDANHAKDLPVFAEQCLAFARQQGVTIDAVAISQGPGSYTGLRIGASVAKGLCYGLRVPLIPVDTLQVMAAAVSTPKEANALLCPMLDARRMEVYTALYRPGSLKRIGEVEAKVMDAQSFAQELAEHVLYIFGPGAEKCLTVWQHPNLRIIPGIIPHAKQVGELVHNAPCTMLDEKQLAYFEPFYLKEFIPAPSHVKGLE